MLLSRKEENLIQQLQNHHLKRQEVCAVDLKVAMTVRVHVHVTQLLPDGICVVFFFFFSFFLYYKIRKLLAFSFMHRHPFERNLILQRQALKT